jgi:predicted dinucleotide-binding enzyme
MKIGVIGAGQVGGTLGKKWAGAGHEVWFGVRNPADEKFDDFRAIGRVVAIGAAVAEAEVVLLAQPGTAVADFAAEYGERLAGKLVIDSTNQIRTEEMNNLAVLKKLAAGAEIARAFSTLGWENFAEPQLGGESIDLFFCCGEGCRARMEELIGDVGLRPVYVGELESAAILDGLTRLWFALAFGQGRGRRIAFKLQDGEG